MVCEIFDCCQFIKEHMAELPKAAELMVSRLCQGEYQSCHRYRIYRQFIGEEIPFDLDRSDAEKMDKIMRCVRGKKPSPE